MAYTIKQTNGGIIEHDRGTVVINGGNPLPGCPKSYDEANAWADKANEGKGDPGNWYEPMWSFDCGFKLDFDGPLVDVSSRFYPPKTHYGPKWDGSVSIRLLGKTISRREFEADTLDELKGQAEAFVRGVVLGNADKNHTFMCRKKDVASWEDMENELNYCTLHFVSHFIYTLEIVGYKHPDAAIRKTAMNLYRGIVSEMCHLNVETEGELDIRLDDVSKTTTIEEYFGEFNLVSGKLVPVDKHKHVKPPVCPTGPSDSYTWTGRSS